MGLYDIHEFLLRGVITLFIMVVFGLVRVTLDGIRVVEAIIDDNTFKCAGEINIIGSAFRMMLSLCLTIFVLLHHKVCKPYCVYLIHINNKKGFYSETGK